MILTFDPLFSCHFSPLLNKPSLKWTSLKSLKLRVRIKFFRFGEKRGPWLQRKSGNWNGSLGRDWTQKREKKSHLKKGNLGSIKQSLCKRWPRYIVAQGCGRNSRKPTFGPKSLFKQGGHEKLKLVLARVKSFRIKEASRKNMIGPFSWYFMRRYLLGMSGLTALTKWRKIIRRVWGQHTTEVRIFASRLSCSEFDSQWFQFC